MEKRDRKETLRRLSELRRNSGSDEEFWLKAAVAGDADAVSKALFRTYLFRNEHPGLEWLEVAVVGLGIAGFSLWGGLTGPENLLGAVGILLLALAVLVPLELLFLQFEEMRRDLFGAR